MGRGRFWIALVDVRPDTDTNPNWLEHFGDSAAGGFVHVMGLAPSSKQFVEMIREELSGFGWQAVSVDELELMSELKSREKLSPSFDAMEERLLQTGETQFGRFFLYPTNELTTPEWLATEAQDSRLTATQSTVVGNLGKMLESVDLPDLGSGVGVTGQGQESLEIVLPHRDPAESALRIRVVADSLITFDHGFGHIHFEPGPDWVTDALELVYGALQGGVRVEIWTDPKGTTVEQSRVSMLLENGEWQAVAAWSASRNLDRRNEPDTVRVLSFAGARSVQESEKIR